MDLDDIPIEANHKGVLMGAHRSKFAMPRIQMCSHLLTLTLGLQLAGCGGAELQPIDNAVHTEEEDCLNCGLEPEPAHEVTGSLGYAIDVFPLEMTFFLDAMPEELHVNEPLQITNTSTDRITLLAGDLFQSTDAIDRMNSGTFELINPAIFPISLAPGETLTMSINYHPDTDQSAGLVVIATNHPAQPFLFVTVIGKVFL